MTTTVNLKRILHKPQWEPCGPAPASSAAGTNFRYLKIDTYNINIGFLVVNATTVYAYDAATDAYMLLPSPALTGTFGAGVCSRIHPMGPSGTATAGTTSTITTNLTIVRDLRDYKIRITGGPQSVGSELTILSNTIGANSVITVATQGGAFTTGTTYQLITPRFYVISAGTLAVGSFNYYDFALNTWTQRSITSLSATWGTDGVMIGTPGIINQFDSSATGGYSFNAATGTTLTITGPSWTTNQWTNSQIRITGGLGAGQVRTISSNTATALTVATWTTQPDATSTWVIEGNDDFLYLLGNNAVTMYRFSISGNTWAAMAPTVARGAAPGAGLSASWISNVSDSTWTSKNVIKNGRYIYSFRGANGAILDIFDIAGGTAGAGAWAAQSYGAAAELFTTGASFEYDGRDYIYGMVYNATAQRMVKLSLIKTALEPAATLNYPQGAAVVGDKLVMIPYIDGATRIDFIYHWRNTGQEVFRLLASYLSY